MFKITFSRMREERNYPREVKKISRKMLKKRQNEVKRNIFLFDEVKKTYPADCRKIAAVDSNKHDWD